MLDLIEQALSETLKKIKSKWEVEEPWDDFVKLLYRKYDECVTACSLDPSPAFPPRAVQYFRTSKYQVLNSPTLKPDISLCEPGIKHQRDITPIQIIAFGKLNSDQDCFNNPDQIHQLTNGASQFFTETGNLSLRCFLATNSSIAAFHFISTEGQMSISQKTPVHSIFDEEGIALLACFLLPPKDSLPTLFEHPLLHIEGWKITRFITRGSCSKIYAAESDNGDVAAIKIALQPGSFQLNDELKLMSQLPYRPSLPQPIAAFHYSGSR